MKYKVLYGKEELELIPYVKEYMENNENVEILIGCDSQNFNNRTKIITKNIDEYKFIPIAHSAGGSFALYFAQLYASQCAHVILLDPDLHTPNNMKIRLKMDIDDLKNTKNW